MLEELIDIRNGAKSRSSFSSVEMQARLGRARELLVAHELDALLLSQPESINYFSQLSPLMQDPLAVTLLLITPELSVTLSPCSEGGNAYRSSYGSSYLYRDLPHLLSSLRLLLPSVRQLGIEAWSLGQGLAQAMTQALPSLKATVDLGGRLACMRLHKSPEELSLLAQADEVARAGFAAARAALLEPQPEYQVAEQARAAMLAETARRLPHLTLKDSYALFQSGPNTDGRHTRPSSRHFVPGEVLNLTCCPVLAGYGFEVSRTLFVHYCDDDQARCWEINCAVQQQALSLICPGLAVVELGQALDAIYQRCGLGERRIEPYLPRLQLLMPSLSQTGPVLLEEGMVLTLTTALLLPEGVPGAGGYRETSQILVTASGARRLDSQPIGPAGNILRP